MGTHITMEQLEAFRRGALARDEVPFVAAHIAECADCRTQPAGLDAVAETLVSDLADFEHPDVDSLFAYADGETGAEIAAHLLVCAQCRTDVDDAKRERSRMQPARGWFGLAAAAVAVIVAGTITYLFLQRQPANPEPPRRVVIRNTPPPSSHGEWEPLVAEARRTRAIPPPPIIRELRGANEAYRGEGERAANGLQPAGVVVASQKPRLTWRPQTGETYVVTIVCNDRIAAISPPVASGEWTPTRPLPRGANCQSQLERQSDHAILPTPPLPQPTFRIADAATLATIHKAAPDDLVQGLLYARAGMQWEAVEHLERYVAGHPEDVAIGEVLRGVKGW